MDGYGLPNGAKGIECEDFAIEFTGNKVLFIVKARGINRHFTLHLGGKSGAIDLHETTDDDTGQKQHRTLFAIRADELQGALQGFEDIVPDLLGLIRPLKLGWLKHRGIGIARGIMPVSEEDFLAVTRRRKRRLSIDQQLYEANIVVPEYLEDVYDFPDGNFSLVRRGNHVGFGFKRTEEDGTVRLLWVKWRDMESLLRKLGSRVWSALERRQVPPESYRQFPFITV